MSFVKTLATNIETSIKTLLPEYTRLNYAVDIEENKLLTHTNRFGVVMGNSNIAEGPLNRVTLDQAVEITITSDYSENHDDIDKVAKANEVSDTLISIYKHLASTNASTSGVRLVSLESISDTEYLEEKVLYRTANITIQHLA
ncbi:MAG: hypothetical protein ACOH5I_21895 [Oligoflexus sp.]